MVIHHLSNTEPLALYITGHGSKTIQEVIIDGQSSYSHDISMYNPKILAEVSFQM
jgi:hypothetical protein